MTCSLFHANTVFAVKTPFSENKLTLTEQNEIGADTDLIGLAQKIANISI